MKTNKSWSKDEMTHLYSSRLARKPYRLIAVELGRTEKACESKYRETDWSGLGLVDQEAEENRFSEVSKFTDKQINVLEARYKTFQMRTEAIVDAVTRAIDVLPKVERPIYKPVKGKTKNSPEDVGLLLSDLHIGQEHSLEETGGLSEYNLDVFFRRLENMKKAIAEIYELHSQLYQLPTLHIFCAGDIVAGMNAAGSWSPLYIASPIVEQMITAFDALRGLIYYALGMFENVRFYGVVGNHGRAAPLGQQKDHDNWDYVAYKFLETSFKDNPQVTFNIPKAWWMMETIRNHQFLLVHGDHVRSGGLPLKGLQTFEQKMSSILRTTPDYTLAGHYHNAAELTTSSGKIILNGSFVGSDVYSLKTVHAASKPEQKLFGIHGTHGVTWTYNINLDIPRG